MRAVLVLVAGLMALAFPQMASATGHDGTEGEEGGGSTISCGGQLLTTAALSPTSAAATTEEACANYSLGACKTVWAGRKRTNTLGQVVWRYRQEIYFCWRYPQITYLSRTRWGKTYLPCCWDYQGHIGNATSWNARWSYRAFTEGRFVYITDWLSISKTPSIWMTVYGNGTWTRRTES